MSTREWEPTLGAILQENNQCRFRLWAPKARSIEADLQDGRRVLLEPVGNEYFEAVVEDAGPGTRYLYHLDGGDGRPDPASRFQPEGIHGPSEVIDRRFGWSDEGWTPEFRLSVLSIQNCLVA